MENKKTKYAWGKKSDAELQLWPDTSYERYITRPFVEAKAVSRKSKKRLFFWPEAEDCAEQLKRYGIAAAALTTHLSGYYQSRAGAEFNLIMYTMGGGATLSYKGLKTQLVKNTVAVIPAGTPYDLKSRAKGWKVIWFHLDAGRLPDFFTEKISVLPSKNAASIERIFDLYVGEIYSPTPSRRMLESAADVLFCLLSRDLKAYEDICRRDAYDTKIFRIKNSISRNWTIVKVCKFFKLPPKKLNGLFMEKFAMSFSKTLLMWRMSFSQKLLSDSQLPLSSIAKKTGYADAFAFSKAFKRYYKKSPSTIRT